MSRYARQIMLSEVGVEGQSRLAAARVLVVGAGGLAAPLLPLLAGAGVGHLTVLDPDVIELSNLHRQTLFRQEECGKPKAQIAALRCRDINGEIEVDAKNQALTVENAADLAGQSDLVLDCADSYAASYVLSDACKDARVPLISASVLGLGGYAGGFCGDGPSLRALFPDMPDNTASCATAGVLGPVVAMLGAMQAQMALAVLLRLDPSPVGQLIRIEAGNYRLSGFRFDAAPEPDTCLRFAAPSQLSAADMIVDLRPETEAPVPAHPAAWRLLPEQVQAHLPDPATRLVLCCSSGLRAWRTAEKIKQTWPGEVVLVAAATS